MGNNDTVQGKIRNKLWSSGVWVDCETHHQQRVKQSGINREVGAPSGTPSKYQPNPNDPFQHKTPPLTRVRFLEPNQQDFSSNSSLLVCCFYNLLQFYEGMSIIKIFINILPWLFMSFLNKARTVLWQVTFISLRFHILKMEIIPRFLEDKI